MTGTLNIVDLAARLAGVGRVARRSSPRSPSSPSASASSSRSFRSTPWLPNAYAYAPSVVTTFLAATATKVAVYVLLRFFFTVFGARVASPTACRCGRCIVGLSVAAMVAMSLVAVFQPDLKRMFAYSSVAQIGYITLGHRARETRRASPAASSTLSTTASPRARSSCSPAASRSAAGARSIADLRGLGWRMPLTAFGLRRSPGCRPDRHSGHRRLHLEVVPGRRRDRERAGGGSRADRRGR